jgi:hypothetical protein
MDFATSNLIGRLGNAMFQVAATTSYALDNNLSPKFPQIKNKPYKHYSKNVFRKLNFDNVKATSIEFEYQEQNFEYSEIPKYKNVLLKGYYQSEKYFINNKDIIYDLFKPDEKIKNKIQKKYGSLLKNSVSCHVRLGDYEKLSNHHPVLLQTNYYKNIISQLNNKNILIFSDDINSCKNYELFQSDNIYFITGEKDFVDLYTMSLCENHIIANSSFSWWGAWLNKKDNKKVFYPEKWFGPAKTYSTKDLFPTNWTKVSC